MNRIENVREVECLNSRKAVNEYLKVSAWILLDAVTLPCGTEQYILGKVKEDTDA